MNSQSTQFDARNRSLARISVGALGGISLLFAIIFILVPVLNPLIVGASLMTHAFCSFIFVMNETLRPQENPFDDAINIGKFYFAALFLGAVFTVLDRLGFSALLEPVTQVLTYGEVVVSIGLYACTAMIFRQYQLDLKEGKNE